jgi:hypothetical protein
MIQCLLVADFLYFISMLGDIVAPLTLDLTMYVVEAETGSVIWKLFENEDVTKNAYCIIFGGVVI